MRTCPVCHGTRWDVLASELQVEEETRIRERFVQNRLTSGISRADLKDLTEFFHQAKAAILSCANCSLLLRQELERLPAESYSDEEYDVDVMEHQYPSYLAAFRRKEQPYRLLLPAAARVLEIGSHYGAFLAVAKEWGWHAEGVDLGKDTTLFARGKGNIVHHAPLEQCRFAARSFDGVFIWNCFDQIEAPGPLLRECRRVLKDGGVLAVRTPNGLFYAMCRRVLDSGGLSAKPEQFLIDAMGYNNLLGFPYLYGYSQGALQRLIEPYGFRVEGMLNSELLTLPLPEASEWVEEQEQAINTELKLLAHSVLQGHEGVLAGPWIEIWFRSDA